MEARLPGVTKKKSQVSTRKALLDAVAEIMKEQETVDVSLSEIAKHTGMNTALVKYYFGSKSEMVMELLSDVVGGSMGKLTELIEMDLPADQKLRLHIAAIVNIFFDYPFLNRLIHRFGRIEDGRFAPRLANEIVTPIYEAHVAIIDQGVEEGLFLNVDPMYLYFHISGACDAIFHAKYALEYCFKIKKITKEMKEEHSEQISSIVLKGISV